MPKKKPKKTPVAATNHVHQVELSPLQRFLMLPAFRQWKEPFANAEEGRLFRRTYGKIGLTPIGIANDLNAGRLSAAQVNDQTPSSFVLDFHEVQMLKRVLATQSRNGSTELLLGPVADVVDDIVDGKETPAPVSPPFDPARESWDPPVEGRA